ncbi:large ribosomal subunit protein mL101 (rPPR4)-like [Cicer arietinum]|uniref:Pentatricopeptide repeat-containing protein At1g60770-like n=1 Tax=Cicer arietinum TaxID=3827 RepID=A0A1S2YTG4_CICAR|nr:pentatricopeptide repeat-containing protein At1g60770-like [Cicer arietinum]
MSLMQRYGRCKSVVKRSKKYLDEALYLKLFKDGGSQLNVRQQLNHFIKSGKRVYKWEVGDTLKKLRQRKLYQPALKLSETMAKRNMIKTVSDQAIHIDLIAKAKGIVAAENYFVNLPESAKNHLCYGALLNCYCKELMTDKAEGVVEKMKDLGLPLSSMPYNSLMTLYTKVGQPEKIPSMIQEMKASNIMLDSYTYNVWMRALAAVNDISGVERVIDEMKRDGRVIGDWTTYSNLASIYVDAGLFEKAEGALKELEKRNAYKNLSAYQFVITLYGRINKIYEVYRVWRSLRLAFPKTANISYLNMIQVLVNLKDLPGAEKCFREWESTCNTYDIRVANALIEAYAKLDMLEKAEELKERARRRGAKPNAKTWEIFLDCHLRKGDFKLAVDCLTEAISIGRGNGEKWVPSSETIGIMMRHYEQEKDVDGAEEFIEILKKSVDSVGAEVFESLIRTYATAGKTSSSLQRRLKMENVNVNEDTQKLLEAISVE